MQNIYLLHFSKFLNDQTTLVGSNLISQDVYLLENNPEFSARLRFVQRKGLTQYALLRERSFSRERSIRLRWQLIKEISNQIDFVQKIDNLAASQFSNRVRSVNLNSLALDWSYRPEQNIEVGFKFGVGQASNFDTTTADLNDQSVRVLYSLLGQGQARIEVGREEVILAKATGVLPFELTNGKVTGKTWLWRAALDYRITNFIQSTVTYDGRIEGGGHPVHTASAEVRAFF